MVIIIITPLVGATVIVSRASSSSRLPSALVLVVIIVIIIILIPRVIRGAIIPRKYGIIVMRRALCHYEVSVFAFSETSQQTVIGDLLNRQCHGSGVRAMKASQ